MELEGGLWAYCAKCGLLLVGCSGHTVVHFCPKLTQLKNGWFGKRNLKTKYFRHLDNEAARERIRQGKP